MKRLAIAAALLLPFAAAADAGADAEESAGGETYVGAAGTLVLPQGGAARMRRLGGAALRAGRYFAEFAAVEAECAWTEDAAGLAAQALWHWQGAEFYGNLFGYSTFDPFFTAGAKGWIGRHCGQVGPKTGVGAFWHLTDDWSLRFDADAILGLDCAAEVHYTLSAGVQRSF